MGVSRLDALKFIMEWAEIFLPERLCVELAQDAGREREPGGGILTTSLGLICIAEYFVMLMLF